MKECKIINVHDGNPEKITEQPFFTVTEYFTAEKEINAFLNEGWEVKSATPHYSPNMIKEGNFSFYLDGMTFYLERDSKKIP